MADKTEAGKTQPSKGQAPKVEPAKPAAPVAKAAKAVEPPKPAAPALSAAAPTPSSPAPGFDPVRSVSAKPGATTAPAGKPAAAKSTSPDAVKAVPEVAKSAAERVTAQAPKIMSAPGAKAAQPEPVEATAPKRGRPPKMTSVENPVPTVAHTAEPAAAIATSEGSKTMNETVTKVQDSAKKITNEAAGLTQEAAGRTQALFGEITERAKSSYEKGVQLAEEISEFSKGNVEAFVESSKVAAKGVESLSQEAADYARKTLENSTSAFKTFASAKSPTEFFRLQSDYAKSYFDNAVAESSKITEAWLKLAGDVAQPLSNRYAVAVEKIKQVAA